MYSLLNKCIEIETKNYQDKHELMFCINKLIIRFIETYPCYISNYKDYALAEAEKLKDEDYIDDQTIKIVALIYANCQINLEKVTSFLHLLMEHDWSLLIYSCVIKIVLKPELRDTVEFEVLDSIVSRIVEVCHEHPITQIMPKSIDDILELFCIYLEKNSNLEIYKKQKILRAISKFINNGSTYKIFTILEFMAKNPSGVKKRLNKCISHINPQDPKVCLRFNVVKIILNEKETITDDLLNSMIDHIGEFPLSTVINLAEKMIDFLRSIDEMSPVVSEFIDELLENLKAHLDESEGDICALIERTGDRLDYYFKQKL